MRNLLLNSADAIMLTIISLLFGITAMANPMNFAIYVTLCVISTIVFIIQYFLEMEVGLLSGLLRCLKGGIE